MGDLSPHFSRSEFVCKHCGMGAPVDRRLVDVLERIRAITGKPLVIVSGSRCIPHNRAVGGVPNSRHVAGQAADIAAERATGAQARAAGATGVGLKGPWAVHVDVRRTSPATWRY
uniref:Peptidase M15A C-terminal domain-containing protein n=1 Tax=uncultured prokaryote TaxID=198431 RepID=A0A0H5Q4W8_9ZZZZ|nr:hypothetical protein [uncultured prokaryote]